MYLNIPNHHILIYKTKYPTKAAATIVKLEMASLLPAPAYSIVLEVYEAGAPDTLVLAASTTEVATIGAVVG